MKFSIALLLLFFFTVNAAAQDALIDDYEDNLEEVEHENQFNIYIKTEFPTHHAIGFQLIHESGFTSDFSLGLMSGTYNNFVFNNLPDEDLNAAKRKDFILDVMENGMVFSLGIGYHFKQFKHFSIGMGLQMQQFSLLATPRELVEEYDFGNETGLANDIDAIIEENPNADFFYRSVLVEPIIRPLQLGFNLNKGFSINKRLSFHIDAAYWFNIATFTEISSPSLVGRLMVNQALSPLVDSGSDESFDQFSYPSISIGLKFRFSE